MKKLLILFIYLLLPIPLLLAQATISFVYDNDGNMTDRTIELPPTRAMTKENEKMEEPVFKSTFIGEQKITIYPNPTRGQVRLNIFPLDTEADNLFMLYNSAGQLIESRRIEGESTPIDITREPGVYILNIRLGENTSQWKIIKQ